MSRLLAPVATVFAIAWVTLVVAAPQLSPSVAAIIYAFGSLICHQRPERSFHLAGAQLPVCARCLGIYMGVAIGLIVATASELYTTGRTLQTFVGRALRSRPAPTLVVAAVPTVFTIWFEWSGLGDPGNAIRALAGAVAGAGVAAVVVTLHYDECTPRRPIASSPRRPPI